MIAVARKIPADSFLLCAFLIFLVCLTAAAQPVSAPLAAADAAMQAGRFADAASAYETWLKAHPNAKEVLLALGICYVQLARRDEAIATLRRHVKLAPQSAAGQAALGIALLDGARTAEAKAALETAVRLNPKQRDAVEALARIYLVEGRADRAALLLRPLITPSTNDETLALFGDALIRSGQAKAAAVALDRRLQARPRSAAQIYALAAWAHLRAGDQARAAEVCEQGLRLWPDSEIEAAYLALPAPFLAERIGARIEQLQKAPDAAEMIALGRTLIDADPARRTRAGEIAQRMLADAISMSPGNASAHYNYGRALSRSSVEQALAEWEKALALNPDGELRLQILLRIGAARLDLADFDAAEQAYQSALELSRNLPRRNPEAALEYGRFLQLRSRTAEAETLLNETLSRNPFSPQAHLELAKLLAARGQWARVTEEGEFVVQNAGEDEELLRAAHLLLARAYLKLNQPEKARRHQAWIESH
ncbi:MAG TPA: tetratricopeptide repeat protein [Blastocatellia bacterium]|nr:tetratricopeptide repeat protein [Blastocatellia bacterium]